jgi:hypothetical protein
MKRGEAEFVVAVGMTVSTFWEIVPFSPKTPRFIYQGTRKVNGIHWVFPVKKPLFSPLKNRPA